MVEIMECSGSSLQWKTFYIPAFDDTGLSGDYRYFYDYVASRCDGRTECLPIQIPAWWNLIDETNTPVTFAFENGTEFVSNCPEGETKYVSGVLIHLQCKSESYFYNSIIEQNIQEAEHGVSFYLLYADWLID